MSLSLNDLGGGEELAEARGAGVADVQGDALELGLVLGAHADGDLHCLVGVRASGARPLGRQLRANRHLRGQGGKGRWER